jgi:hypothetical protein
LFHISAAKVRKNALRSKLLSTKRPLSFDEFVTSPAGSLFQDDLLAIGITDGLDEVHEVRELRLVVAA